MVGTAERSGIQTKTFHERKNQNHPSPRRSPASRWSALRQWHTNQYSKKADPHIRYRFPRAAAQRDPASKQKPSHERKNQNHPSPRRSPASRWSALRQWHTNQHSQKGDPHIRYRFPRLILG